MERIHCHTNLDLLNEVWPKELSRVPCVGEEIQSQTNHYCRGDFRLSLKVVAVRWEYNNQSMSYIPEIELHNIIKNRTVREFYEWYARITGKM